MTDHIKARREYIRWVLLQGMYNARPIGAGEGMLLSIIQAIPVESSPLEIRRELDYLEGRELVEIVRDPSGPWRASVTRHGVDYVEYNIDSQPGISRPPKYW